MVRTDSTRAESDWTVPRFFRLLGSLGRLRVISACGPSVFEALCEVAPFSLEGGFPNIVTPAYHWHLASDRIRVLRSHDTTHARSGRRVLFFELREQSEAAPFLRIYLHREKGVDFAPEILARFLEAHAALGEGLVLARESGSDPLTPSASVVPAP